MYSNRETKHPREEGGRGGEGGGRGVGGGKGGGGGHLYLYQTKATSLDAVAFYRHPIDDTC